MKNQRRIIVDDFRIATEKFDEGWTMPYAHYHTAYEIYIHTSGERVVTIGDKEYKVTSNDAALFVSDVPHKSKGDIPFSGICIHFSDAYLDLYYQERAKKNLLRCFEKAVIRLGDDDLKIIRRIAESFSSDTPNNYLNIGMILNIMCRSAEIKEIKPPSQIKSIKKSEMITQYVNDNYVYIKRISDITERFNVSENYVFRVFHKYYEMTPKQYINKLRIKNACRILRHTDEGIKQIARGCGFESYEHFLYVFKPIIGCTPTEYRKNIKERN